MDKLETYLNDHLTGSIVAIDLARRRATAQGDDEIGRFLRTFVTDVEADQQTLRDAIRDVGGSARTSRELLGTATSWLDSLRGAINLPGAPNLVRDLEILIMGVTGKELVWKALDVLGVTTDPPLAVLITRAHEQIAGLRTLHAIAVEREFGERND